MTSMTYQERVIALTRSAIDTLFRTARAVPADKLDWRPLDEGRSVLDQLQECAQIPLWHARFLQTRVVYPVDEESFRQELEKRRQWSTLDECERACRDNGERLFAAIRAIPDDELDHMIELPFNGGMSLSLADILMLHHNNTIYHLGQINYIQTLYGDKDMH